jgi:hypothetical protein
MLLISMSNCDFNRQDYFSSMASQAKILSLMAEVGSWVSPGPWTWRLGNSFRDLPSGQRMHVGGNQDIYLYDLDVARG